MPSPDPITRIASPDDRLTAAFARVTDARYAIGILQTCGLDPMDIELELVPDDRGVGLVLLRVAIAGVARDRVLAAISGGHGIPMPEPPVAAAPAGTVAQGRVA